MVIANRPMRYQENADSNWIVLAQASSYPNYGSSASRTGMYSSNFLSYTHIDHVTGHDDLIFAYVGEVEIGIGYDWTMYADVDTSLRDVPGYNDFFGALELLDYESDDPVVTEAISQLQAMVDAARTGAGLPVHSSESSK